MYPALKLPLRPGSPRYVNRSELRLGVCAASVEDARIDSVEGAFTGGFGPQADSNMEMEMIHVYLEIIGSFPHTAN